MKRNYELHEFYEFRHFNFAAKSANFNESYMRLSIRINPQRSCKIHS